MNGFRIREVAALKLGGLLGQMVADRFDRDLVGRIVGNDVLSAAPLGVGEDVRGLLKRRSDRRILDSSFRSTIAIHQRILISLLHDAF